MRHKSFHQASPFEGWYGASDTPASSSGHHSGLLLQLDDEHNPTDIMHSAFAALDTVDSLPAAAQGGTQGAQEAAPAPSHAGPPAGPPLPTAPTVPTAVQTGPPASSSSGPASQHPALASVATVCGPLSNPLFYCPLTMDIMEDPVVAEDGRVYERAIIEDFIRAKGVSPFTRQPLSIERLQPCWFIKAAIESARTETAMKQRRAGK